MGDDEGFTRKLSVLIKPSQYAELERIASDRGDDAIAGVVREAFKEYIERKNNPDILREQIRQVMREDPTILDLAIKKLRLEVRPADDA